MPWPLYPGNDPVPIVQEADGPQGRSGQVRNISPTSGFDTRTVSPYALPAHILAVPQLITSNKL